LVLLPLFGLLYQPRMIDDDDDDDDECGAVGEMRIGWGNRSTRRKPASVPIYPPQIPYELTWARIQRYIARGIIVTRGQVAEGNCALFTTHAPPNASCSVSSGGDSQQR
jgi:hypothetical protein